nr:PREDICTED: squamous cell carcinoma antigen recognized by T-cells 3 [Latimeria chalumnae]|eukprot:XP_014350136.1 PREDICTED: squamous cell carcinoma antigen recognized by T-cells 3 [Latimeria chalumnae]
MATRESEEETHQQQMEEEEAAEERGMASESEEEMEKEESEETEESSEEEDDEKENEAEIQRLEEQFPEIWLDWLKDEIRLTSEDSDREKIYELFEKAVKDYICPEIWLEYAQYSIGGMGQEGGIGKVRDVFERALTAVGLHMTKGAAIWEAYREFENAILGTLQPAAGTVPSPEQQETLDAQIEKIHSLFRRQVAVPLLDMEATYAEYEEWSEESIPETVTRLYKKALQQMEKCKPYEETLLVAETPKLAEYQAYIDFELKEGDPARIQLIFERALAENCLVPDLWARYTRYLDRQLKIKDLVLSAHLRAVRNCPWTVGLWKSYLLALERHDADHQTVSDTFEKALNAGFIQAMDYVEIWQAYLDYLRRRVDFTEGMAFDRQTDCEMIAPILLHMAQAITAVNTHDFCGLAHHCKNMQKARELWDSIMTKGNAKYANMWLEYYNLERAHGDTQHCRKALVRAVQCTSDYPEHVCEVLLTFERVEGTLEDWDTAVQKTEARLARVNDQRAKTAEKEALLAKQEEEKAEQRRKARAEKKSQKKAKAKATKAGEKRKADDEEDDEWGEELEQPSKKYRGEGDASFPEEEETEDMETETGLMGRCTAFKTVDNPSKQKTKAGTAKLSKILHDSSKDHITVFISNLSFNIENPEETLRATFASCGEISEIRPVYKQNGTFRGYGYVEFKDEKSALDALRLDRTKIEGRPMFVSPCIDKSKRPDFKVFKYNTALEKHKLFVSGLPFSCTKEELEEICKQHGNVRDIRMVISRAGKFKGIAYIEYENEAQASQAVLKMDGMTVGERVIAVAISNPPQRKISERPGTSNFYESMAPRQVHDAHGKRRTQVALLPRALQRQNAPETKTENGTLRSQAMPFSSASEQEGSRKLSNADFARMLLKK